MSVGYSFTRALVSHVVIELFGTLFESNHLCAPIFIASYRTAEFLIIGFVDDTNVYRVTMYVKKSFSPFEFALMPFS